MTNHIRGKKAAGQHATSATNKVATESGANLGDQATSRSSRQLSDDIPTQVNAACDEALAAYDGVGRLEKILTWHAKATLVEHEARLTIGNWAFKQFENAAISHDAAAFELLIGAGIEPIAIMPIAELRPLHEAAGEGFERGVILLLEAGADIDAATYLGWRAIHLALFYRQNDVVHELLRHGAEIRNPPSDWSPLMQEVCRWPGLRCDLLGALIDRREGAASVAQQLAETREVAESYRNAPALKELARLAAEEARKEHPTSENS
jgi:hypothetical protein